MQSARTALKVISVIMIVLAILEIVSGALLTAGSGLPGMDTTLIANGGVEMSVGMGALAFGIVGIIGGLVYLIIGILGWRGAKNPAKIGPFFWLCIIGLVFAIVDIVMALMSGTTIAPASIIEVIIIIICLALADNIRKNYRGIGM